MKKFSFSLERVRSFKEQVEQNIKNEHTEILQSIKKEEEVLMALEKEFLLQRDKIEQEKLQGCTINTITLYEAYLKSLRDKIKRQEQVIAALKVREKKKLAELIEAKKETKTLDMLKGKREVEYNNLIQKKEEEFIDEFVSNTTSKVNAG